MELEDSPVIELTSDEDADIGDERNTFMPTGKHACPLQFLGKFRNRRFIAWCVPMLVMLLVLSFAFSAGIVVGHFTASTHEETSLATATPATPNPVTPTATIPICPCSNNQVQEDICANPPVLLISLDGFWNGYFQRNITPSLSSLGQDGVQAEFVRSVFPSKTFPNHFSLVTGLYPDSHGIVDNNFYDKILMDSFSIGNNDPKWWLGEPVWVTAGKQGIKSGVYFWPGSEVPIQGMHPTYYEKYDSSVPYDERVFKILEWLDYPTPFRPQFLSLYLNEPDHSGHQNGPNSVEVDAALGRVDEVIQDLIVQLKEKEIFNCVNIIVVSDHGMTTSDPSKLFFIQPYIPDERHVSYSSYGVNMHINVDGNDTALQAVYAAIQNISNGPFQTFYLKDAPMRMHIGRYNTHRYGDIFLAGELGSYITHKSSSGVPPGEHGYDNNEVSMQSIFVAHGPAFKKGYVAPAFDNIQTYNLLCALLNIPPSDNNGTFGALHHMLKQNLSDTLPPVEVSEGVQGVTVDCVLPNVFMCETCICTYTCPANMSNPELVSDPNQVIHYQRMHLPLGVPSGGQGGGACLLTNKHSVTLYSTTLHIPLWVAFTLTEEMTLQSVHGCYQKDPRTLSVECTDFNSSQALYTRTHLAPSAGGTYLPFISNSVPQLQQYNQMLWSEWEQQLMQWTHMYGTLHVITGSLLDSDQDSIRDDDADYEQWLSGMGSVGIPSGFYSVVSRCVPATTEPCPVSHVEVLGLMLPHKKVFVENASVILQFYLSTVWDIESITGINFFPDLLPKQQTRLKLHIVPKLWH